MQQPHHNRSDQLDHIRSSQITLDSKIYHITMQDADAITSPMLVGLGNERNVVAAAGLPTARTNHLSRTNKLNGNKRSITYGKLE